MDFKIKTQRRFSSLATITPCDFFHRAAEFFSASRVAFVITERCHSGLEWTTYNVVSSSGPACPQHSPSPPIARHLFMELTFQEGPKQKPLFRSDPLAQSPLSSFFIFLVLEPGCRGQDPLRLQRHVGSCWPHTVELAEPA